MCVLFQLHLTTWVESWSGQGDGLNQACGLVKQVKQRDGGGTKGIWKGEIMTEYGIQACQGGAKVIKEVKESER